MDTNLLKKGLLEIELLKDRLLKAIASAEHETFAQKDSFNQHSITHQKKNDLRTRVFSPEYSVIFHKILQKADFIVENSSNKELIEMSKKYGIESMFTKMGDDQAKEYINELNNLDTNFGMSNNNDDSDNLYFTQSVINNDRKIVDKRNEMVYNFTDKTDPYSEIEDSFSNDYRDPIPTDKLYSQAQLRELPKTFKFKRDLLSNYRLESYAEAVHIKRIDNDTKLVEFYINKKSINITNQVVENLINWNTFSVENRYGDEFSFTNIRFHKLSETTSFHVVKFICHKLKTQKTLLF